MPMCDGGRSRHWRVIRGTVGMRSPVCVCCGSPNPKPLTDDEWRDLIELAKDHNIGDHARTAIEKRREESGGGDNGVPGSGPAVR